MGKDRTREDTGYDPNQTNRRKEVLCTLTVSPDVSALATGSLTAIIPPIHSVLGKWPSKGQYFLHCSLYSS
jgi:hypothetical protein